MMIRLKAIQAGLLAASILFVGSAHAAPGDFTDSGQRLSAPPGTSGGPAFSIGADFGDLDGDGDLDAAVANAFGSNFGQTGWWSNDGSGNFSIVQTFGPNHASGVNIGDLDGDLDLDVFLLAGSSQVWLNNGTGTLTNSGQALAADCGLTCDAELADLDGDGDLDVFVVGHGPGANDSRVYLNNGSGIFLSNGQNLASGRDVALADMDADGDIDAYVACGCGAIPNTLLFNNGSGVFTPSTQLVVGAQEHSVDLADVDGDGDNDAYLVGGGASKTRIWLNDGSGFLTDTGQAINTHSGSKVILEDLDGDGDRDAFSLSGSNPTYVLFNDGTGVFTINQTLATSGQGFALGDVNGNGALDVFVARGRIANEVWLNEPNLAPNLPPTADAGADQAIRAGDTVFLDGSGSFDDNTASASLLYSWSFSSLPGGSSASLVGANTATPSFAADLADTYGIALVVTDEGGLPSVADEIVASADNLAPTAAAGSDQLVIIGTLVNLDGSDSTDPEPDPLTYDWTLLSQPAGSGAALTGDNTVGPSFIPDLPGSYEVNLVVSDFIGPGAPDTVGITAATAEAFSEIQIVSANSAITGLASGQVTTKGNRNALLNFLSQAVVAIQAGDLTEAINKLEKALLRSDGCVLRGSADGNGPGRDWITDCTAQIDTYNFLNAALDAITP